MTTTLLRAGALSCALLATTCLTAPAAAQSESDLPPPERHQIDENGVDVARGRHSLSITDIAIGPDGPGGLAYVRQLEGLGGGRSSYDMGLFQSGSTWRATVGLQSYAFSLSGTTYTSTDGSGATLVKSGTTHTLTTAEGIVVTYDYNTLATSDASRKSRATSIVYPTGERITLSWASAFYCSTNLDGCTPSRTAVRLQAVSSSLGYQLHLNYTIGDAYILAEYNAWKQLNSITAINTTVDACNPAAHACTLTQTWPTTSYSGNAVTDPANRTTTYVTGATSLAIRRPSGTSDNVVYNYSAGRVSSVVRDGLTWAYNYSTSGNVATMVVTDPGSHSRTIVSDLAVGLPTSVTNALSQTTAYTYTGSGQLQRTTAPEGNYVELSYDGRGNVEEVRAVAKPGSGFADIVTAADFPDTCANPRTCNQPASTTDSRGNVTEYSYDGTHGGVLTATAPAPSSGAVRPQTRYTYSGLTAPGGGTVYRLTATSQCRTLASCAGQADEVKTTIAYAQANLLPSSITAGSGDGALTAIVIPGYDHIGRPVTMDGPLSGTADTSRIRYNLAGDVIGAVSPDPDGAGALKHRARRTTYNSDGQVSKIETGTVNSQSDGDWAAFAPLETVDIAYDSSARPIRQTLTGSDSVVRALSQTSYDGEGRPACVAQRMNPSEFAPASLPADACTQETSQGSYGPDRIARTTYDSIDRATKVEAGVGTGDGADEVAATYTANGRIATVTDGNNNKTTFEYDGQDRLRYTRFPLPGTPGTSAPTSGETADYEALTYEPAPGGTRTTPFVSSRRARDGAVITYFHDALGRLGVINRPTMSGSSYDLLDSHFVYDNLGRMIVAAHENTDVPGRAPWNLYFDHDSLGRLVSQTDPIGTVGYQYDAAGRRTRTTYPGSGLYVEYDYLVTGEVTKIRENGATSGIGVLGSYAYDDRGRRTSLTRGNGTITSYGYDAASRLDQIVQNLTGTSHDLTLDFDHNPAGQITQNVRSNTAFSFTGHANLNRTDSHDGRNRILTTGGTIIQHDARGNLTYDGTRSFGYTTENVMISRWPHSLRYDPLGRLVHTDTATGIDRFGYDGASLIAEYDGAAGNAVARRYVHGPGIDEPLVWYEGSGTGTRRWFHQDERGSVIAVSDASGNLVGATPNRYDEYGVPQGTLTGRFGYTGQMWLPNVGLYYYRARMFNPELGRFMQTDPISYEGGMNLYGYVGGDPMNRSDPSGLGYFPSRIELKQNENGTRSWGWSSGGSSGGGLFDSNGNMRVEVAANVLWERQAWYYPTIDWQSPWEYTGRYQVVSGGVDSMMLASGAFGESGERGSRNTLPTGVGALQILRQTARQCPNGGTTRRMMATGYDNSFNSTGKNPGDPAYGITADGSVAGPGTIAAPRNYSFGTMMYVPGYGLGIVQDRGGAITGAHIDLWFGTEQQALEWGNPTVDVEVCND